jgi:hypothetical protein
MSETERKDPKRITVIVEELRKLWEKEPDQRLGQVLENHVFTKGKRGDKTSRMMFYQEDNETLTTLRKANQEKQSRDTKKSGTGEIV